MGDLFGAFQKVSPQNKNNSFDQIAAYEEYYMKLLKRYQGDIQNIEEMMENLRKERKDFYLKELPAIQKAMVEDDVLSNDCKAEWLTELQKNVERSFQISESLIWHISRKIWTSSGRNYGKRQKGCNTCATKKIIDFVSLLHYKLCSSNARSYTRIAWNTNQLFILVCIPLIQNLFGIFIFNLIL